MPISGMGSYRPTMAAFKQHWGLVNGVLTPQVVKLTGGYLLQNFVDDETAVNNAIDAVGPLAQESVDIGAARDLLKEGVRTRILQFRAIVAGQLAGSVFADRAPTTPGPGDGYDLFFKSLGDMLGDWVKINALDEESARLHRAEGFEGPLVLQGGYNLAQFQAAMDALKLAWPASEAQTRTTTQARDNRDALLPLIRARMKQYREVLPGLLPKDSPLLASLPRLTPPTGESPPAAGATGAWDATTQMARFEIPATASAKVEYRSLRVTPGPVYRADDEVTIARIENAETVAQTLEALGNPGSVASFKVYSVGPHGNETGGKAITIVRPMS